MYTESRKTCINPSKILDLSLVVVLWAFGCKFKAGSRNVQIALQAENVFNEAYRSHLIRNKEYAINPVRNFKLKINIPFKLAE